MSRPHDLMDATRALLEQGTRGVLLFDSGRATRVDSPRWSMLMHSPSRVLTTRDGRFVELDEHGKISREVEDAGAWLRAHARAARPPRPRFDAEGDRIPFASGLAGFLGFGFAKELDSVELLRESKSQTPLLWVGKYDSAQVFKHTGEPGSSIKTPRFTARAPVIMARDGVLAGMTRDDAAHWYRARVRQSIEAIVERGDLFEINYAERFLARKAPREAPIDFFARLRAHASGDYMGFLDMGEVQLASISPEQFLSCRDGELVTRPIKGTTRRDSEDATRDRELAIALQQSPKDRAENIMIVDLMRNDLTRVAKLGSVRATELCALESFAGVHHLVSTVRGELEQGFEPMDALLASFPAGSITGAPKLRAMEYITEFEASARGAYTGSMFYASHCGQMDSNVLIRTVEIAGDELRYGAGGAIVSDSDPEAEWQEALLKADLFFGAAAREGDEHA